MSETGIPAPGASYGDRPARPKGLTIRVATLAGAVVTILTVISVGTAYALNGNINGYHALLSLFFSINLPVCYWEICLYLQRDRIEARTKQWRTRQLQTGRTPSVEFLMTEIPFDQALSPTLWANVWATYALYDGSFADRRTFGFNVDIANGFFTPLPALLLHLTFTVGWLPAVIAGILGVMLFWQWSYITTVYWVSFFVARRHKRISRADMYVYIWGTNSPWLLFALLGLYVSVRLIVDGNYAVLGHN